MGAFCLESNVKVQPDTELTLAKTDSSAAAFLGEKKKLHQQFICTMYLLQTTKTVFPSQA